MAPPKEQWRSRGHNWEDAVDYVRVVWRDWRLARLNDDLALVYSRYANCALDVFDAFEICAVLR